MQDDQAGAEIDLTYGAQFTRKFYTSSIEMNYSICGRTLQWILQHINEGLKSVI